MARHHNPNNTAIQALKRMIISLISKDDFNLKNTDRVYILGLSRGMSQQAMNELILDCQVEYSVN